MNAALDPLQVLIVDDSTVDAELLQLLLQDSGVRAHYRHCKNDEQMRAALRTHKPDVVLSDLNMPGFGGLQAYAIACELAPGVPFCLMSDAPDASVTPAQVDALLRKDEIGRLVGLLEGWFGARVRG